VAYAKHLVLRGGLDRVRPLAYSRATGGIRCLTFHYLFDQELDQAHSLFRTLKTHGDFITTPELLELLERPKLPGGRLFHLSIDDGFDNIARNAHAILRELSIPYTFFVCPDLVDLGLEGEEHFRVNAGYRRRLPLASWETLRVLADDGVEIGSHTGTHRLVSSLASEVDLDVEIVRSKVTIEARLARPCTSFAWPFGRVDAMTPAALATARAAGYTALFSSVRGSLAAGEGSLPYLPRHHFEPSWPEAAVVYYATRREKCFAPDPRLSA
jgi:peptidoglycan/xylan/chitin deacetylase (PgdA/CDA1 family)